LKINKVKEALKLQLLVLGLSYLRRLTDWRVAMSISSLLPLFIDFQRQITNSWTRLNINKVQESIILQF